MQNQNQPPWAQSPQQQPQPPHQHSQPMQPMQYGAPPPGYAYYPPQKQKSKLWLILLLVIGIPVGFVILIAGSALLYSASGDVSTPSAAERGTVMTIDDLGPWIVEFTPDKSFETVTKTEYFDGAYDIDYVYEHGDELYLNSMFTLEPKESDAKYSYSGMSMGSSLGSSIAEMEEVERNDLYSWGDASKFYIIKYNGVLNGNCLIARKGRKLVYIFFSGVYFNEPESIKELFDPVMARIDAHK